MRRQHDSSCLFYPTSQHVGSHSTCYPATQNPVLADAIVFEHQSAVFFTCCPSSLTSSPHPHRNPSLQVVPEAPSATRTAAVKWAAIRELLRLGHSVLYSDVDVALLRDPFSLLRRDADLEAMSTALEEQQAYGGGMGQRPCCIKRNTSVACVSVWGGNGV